MSSYFAYEKTPEEGEVLVNSDENIYVFDQVFDSTIMNVENSVEKTQTIIKYDEQKENKNSLMKITLGGLTYFAGQSSYLKKKMKPSISQIISAFGLGVSINGIYEMIKNFGIGNNDRKHIVAEINKKINEYQKKYEELQQKYKEDLLSDEEFNNNVNELLGEMKATIDFLDFLQKK